jgi:hypothetical protein
MTETPKEITIDCSTGVVTERLLTDDEIAQLEVRRAEREEEMAIKETEETALVGLKASAKAKLIAGEPLTEDEASILVL